MQSWDEGHEQASCQPQLVSGMADDGSRLPHEGGYLGVDWWDLSKSSFSNSLSLVVKVMALATIVLLFFFVGIGEK